MTNRIHIDAPTGVIEVEGEKDFVEAQLDKLMPLIQACGFGTRPLQAMQEPSNSTMSNGTPASDAVESDPPAANGRKKPKRAAKATPKGHSCADRMLALRNDGFFKTQKTPAEIAEGLAAKGWTHNANQTAASGVNMFNRGDILRTKVGKGFAYYWDRD